MKTSKLILIILFQSILTLGQNVSINQKWIQIPVLKSKQFSPVLQFQIKSEKHINVKKIALDFNKTTSIKDIDSVFIFNSDKDNFWKISANKLIGKNIVTEKNIVFDFNNPIKIKNSSFIIAVKISENANLSHFVSVKIKHIVLTNYEKITPPKISKQLKQRIGVALKEGGDDGVFRFRIPGLTRTNKNTLLAISDMRRDMHRDLQGDIDIGVNRSTDGGNSWEPIRVALDMGEYNGLPQKYNGVADACILVDKNSNSIYIAGCWMHGVIHGKTGKPVLNLNEDSTYWNHQWWNFGSLQGFDIDKTSQFIITKSTDDGKTWSKPINLTKQIKKYEWHLLAPAPGNGITLNDGTLVFPTQGKDKNQVPFSNITYSKDGGKTWKTSKPSYINTTENAIIQLNNGEIMQNMRDNRNETNKTDSNGRAVFTTKDLGEHWKQHPTHHKDLIEPVCMASIYKHEYIDKNGKQKNVLFFSNPNSKYKRERMTIKVSFDEGKTWPKKYWLLLDELPLIGGYSCLTSINNNTIGILYEGSQANLTFESIKLKELGINDAK